LKPLDYGFEALRVNLVIILLLFQLLNRKSLESWSLFRPISEDRMRRLQTPKISRKTESLKTLDVVGIDAQFKGYRNRQNYGKKISFGGIPNSRNVLFLQIFLKGAAKPSAGNTSAGFP